MSMSLEELETAALQLPSDVRARFAERLLASLDDEADDPDQVEREWEEELRRRIARLEADPTSGVPADEVFARLRRLSN